MDAVFKALSDPTRRRMLDSLNAHGGQNLMQLCAGLDMARQSVSKHLAVLEAANLVTSVRRGREKLHYLNAAPINEIEQRWINQYDRARIQALGDLKLALEGSSVENHQFVYTTYINATPELLWKGLTDPAFTKRYWSIELVTDWKVGSPIVWEHHGVTIADPEQRVLEADPFRRLAYTWHSFTPELAKVVGMDEQRRAELAAETRSQVTFDIEPVDDICKLTVMHEFFEPDSITSTLVSEGWPRVLSELKTLIETGDLLTGDLGA
jgi:DNA-binding transcriptional ArsR family regulator